MGFKPKHTTMETFVAALFVSAVAGFGSFVKDNLSAEDKKMVKMIEKASKDCHGADESLEKVCTTMFTSPEGEAPCLYFFYEMAPEEFEGDTDIETLGAMCQAYHEPCDGEFATA